MLKNLKIRNFALVDDLDLSFDKGLSVLTGETGAGKSVIITALALVLGDRADREQVRHGTAKATIKATFTVDRFSPEFREEFDEYIEDGCIDVVRVINKDGGSKVKINGVVASLTRLQQLTYPFAEILGQHSSRLLTEEEQHLLFLDDFADVVTLRTEVSDLFNAWQTTYQELKSLRGRIDEVTAERELMQFQKDEIEKAEIRVGEENELNDEKKLLESSRTLMESSSTIVQALDGEEQSALDLIRTARKELEKMAGIDSKLDKMVEQITELDYQLEDLRRQVEEYGGSVLDDPARLEEINHRLDEIYRLRKKYGGSEQAVVDKLKALTEQLGDSANTDELLKELEQREQSCRTAYSEKAIQLSAVRHQAAKFLKTLVVRELADLAIEEAKFEFELSYEDHGAGVEYKGRAVKPYRHGLENGRILFSANPGEPLKSLARTASGGEMSRVLLALKAAEQRNRKLSRSLLVFDEADTGIGGQTANSVAQKIRKLADDCQVIVVTHLHQIARLADHHFVASKSSDDEQRATIQVMRLNQDEVGNELSRMVALPDSANVD